MATNSTFVTQLYQTILARDADSSSTSWTSQLDSGFNTRAQTAYAFLNSAEYQQGVEVVARLYYAAFKRMPDLPGLQFWMSVARQGASTDQIATQFVSSAEFKALYGSLDYSGLVDLLYQNVLGRSADADGKASWVALLQKGTATGSVLTGFSNSGEFQNKADPLLANTMAYYAFLGRVPTSTELAATASDLTTIVVNAAAKAPIDGSSVGLSYSAVAMSEAAANDGSIASAVTVSLSGDTFKGVIGASLGKVTGAPSGLTASLTKVTDTTATFTLTGNAKSHAASNSITNMSVAFSTTDFTSASIAGKVGVTQSFSVSFMEIPLVESSGSLTPSGAISGSTLIDLSSEKIIVGTVTTPLTSGTMSSVKNVNASGITGSKVTVSITGDDADNVMVASDLGGTLISGKGSDTLTAGAGVDKFNFAATAADNGVDTIYNFKLGTGGDVLNFAAFLNKTGVTHIAPVSSSTTADAAWTNGDVLVATGNGLNTAAGVATLFGTTAPLAGTFAVPSVAAKSAPSKFVIITADIVGDASIWYVVNQTATTAIDASEITLVGTLKEVNNLDLTGYGFAATNFA